jgi:signal transduction histidine kinase
MLKTDQKRFKQVLFNLLGNAVKFTYQGSIQVSLNYKANKIITMVKDTGIGMKPDEIQKLFRFFGRLTSSNKLNKGGMGFGLTISKMIVQ